MAKRKEPNVHGIEKGKPLQLPDGTTVRQGADGKNVVETQEQREAREFMDELLADPFLEGGNTFKRTLADVNVVAKQFNPVMLVLAYSMWGLDNEAIARYLDLSDEQVAGITSSDLFVRTRQEVLEAIRFVESTTIHGYLSEQARLAAATIAAELRSKDGERRLTAAKDILDRSGYRPTDRVEHTHRFDDELRIVHLQEATAVDVDTGV